MKKIIAMFLISISCISGKSLYEQGSEYQKKEQFAFAMECYDKISCDDADYLSGLFNLGSCYLALGQTQNAINCYSAILKINPRLISALYNIAYTLKSTGNPEAAITIYKAIIEMNDTYDPAHLALGFAYLINGDFENGWKQHTRYLKKSGKNADRLRKLLETNSVAGKNILLLPEGGLGDSLQFIRYAQRLHDMGARVIACVQKSLVPLISLCPYIDHVIPPSDTQQPMSHDAESTLMSLPAVFADTEDTLPNTVPYLYTDETIVQQWKPFFDRDTHFKVGICWQADVHNDVSRLPIARRGCPLKHFYRLKNIPNISLYSLQKYDGVEQIADIPFDFHLHCFDKLDETTAPFMESAAIMKQCDLIITVDTAVAHLAGGLGCKVWLLLPYSTDWRWINKRTDSPWYPTMKIFKQPAPFDWDSIMEELGDELETLANN